MELKIVIRQRSTHPHFGGEKVIQREYDFSHACDAQRDYEESASKDCEYQHTTIYVAHES